MVRLEERNEGIKHRVNVVTFSGEGYRVTLVNGERDDSEDATGRSVAQAIAIVLVTPLNFIGNRLWSFAPRNS